MTKTFLRLMALSLVLVAPAAAQAESIASMTDPDRDYSLEGDVVTVWHDSFLFNDGSGQVIVDVRPFTTRDLKIAGRDYAQVVGRVNSEGVLSPVVIQEAKEQPIMFRDTQARLEPLPMNEVMKNTIRYRLRREVAVGAAPDPRANADLPANSQQQMQQQSGTPQNAAPDYTSTGASPVTAVAPAGSAPGPGTPAGNVPTPPPGNPTARQTP